MAPVVAVGVAGGDVGVGTGVGVDVDVVPPPQATSRTARIRLHIASKEPQGGLARRRTGGNIGQIEFDIRSRARASWLRPCCTMRAGNLVKINASDGISSQIKSGINPQFSCDIWDKSTISDRRHRHRCHPLLHRLLHYM